VQLTATPNNSWSFANWSGDLSSSANPASVTIHGNTTVTANYIQDGYALVVTSVNGTVSKSPDQAGYHAGDVVHLTVTPNSGWSFVGWSGDLSGSDNPASLTIHGNTTVTANYIHGLKFTSIASQDGFVFASSKTSNIGREIVSKSIYLLLGDDFIDTPIRAILSFSTGSLPNNAIVTGVTLKVKQAAVYGDPMTSLKGIMVDVKRGFFGIAPLLESNDFQAVGSKSLGPFKPALENNWFSIDLTGAYAYINKLSTSSGLTQIRLRFKLNHNNNNSMDSLYLFSANASSPGNRPQLIISYRVP